MARSKAIIIMFFVFSVSFSQSFDRYETMKKDKGTGYLMTLAMPAGGMIYTAEHGHSKLITAIIETGLIVWAINSEEKLAPLSMLGIMKVWELSMVYQDVDRYNKQLRVNLRLNL